jgi:prepilin-type N-terminal cleavage/methylation domain-containing protein/prepilin-type processing-associated H-X9-DG protein
MTRRPATDRRSSTTASANVGATYRANIAWRGFTLVELLVVIAIIGILVALLLPAIQAAREAARRSQCTNQLRQLAISFHNHHDVQKHMPTGGWWVTFLGYPEYGFGKEQPGGWMYNILPFMEENALHDLGKGATGAARRQATKERIERPFEGMTCPSRRRANVYDYLSTGNSFIDCDPFDLCSKSDYAANAGDNLSPEPESGLPYTATTYEEGLNHDWTQVRTINLKLETQFTGVVFVRSEINFRQITDGSSKTYMVGEKYLSTDNYDDGLDFGDNEPAFGGGNADTLRITSPAKRFNVKLPLGPDHAGSSDDNGEYIFGSAHTGGFNMAFCDGSVRIIQFDIDPEIHRTYGHRSDGVVVPNQ